MTHQLLVSFREKMEKNTEQRANYHTNEESRNKSGLLICQVKDSLKRCLKKICNPHFPLPCSFQWAGGNFRNITKAAFSENSLLFRDEIEPAIRQCSRDKIIRSCSHEANPQNKFSDEGPVVQFKAKSNQCS